MNKTTVAIIGAGPAGLLLAQMLKNAGISSEIFERRSREYVLGRIRAGVMEPGAMETFIEQGVGERMQREAILLKGASRGRWGGRVYYSDKRGADDRVAAIYGQAEIVKDMIEQHEKDGLPIHWEASVSSLDNLADNPTVHYTHNGEETSIVAEFIAGCDGFLGVSRGHIPGAEQASVLREYPFAWLGIIAEAELQKGLEGYTHHPNGAVVLSRRGRDLSRHYLQVPVGTDPESWGEDEIWDELDLRIQDQEGTKLNRGKIISKDVTQLRAFICRKMRHERLLIAGDAAHIVPPTGAKGMNLAVGDVRILFETVRRFLESGDTEMLDNYSEICLRRIVPMVRWADLLCRTVHIFPGQSEFETLMQEAAFNNWFNTESGQTEYTESFLGAPYEY